MQNTQLLAPIPLRLCSFSEQRNYNGTLEGAGQRARFVRGDRSSDDPRYRRPVPRGTHWRWEVYFYFHVRVSPGSDCMRISESGGYTMHVVPDRCLGRRHCWRSMWFDSPWNLAFGPSVYYFSTPEGAHYHPRTARALALAPCPPDTC